VIKLTAKQLRTSVKNIEEFKKLSENPIYIILDNVLDTYNIGSIFRLADAVAVKKVILCGDTQIPPNSRIKKASINTTEWVEWEYAMTAVAAILRLKSQISKLKVIAIEQSKKSIPYAKMKVEFPVALVVGNETIGVSKEVLKMADEIIELPMFGVNISLNVMVSLAIVLYKIIESSKITNG
jgi:tRNA G18 (ribose-2'-O)-methylase SpoU